MTEQEARAQAERIVGKGGDLEPAEREEKISVIAGKLAAAGKVAPPPPMLERDNSPEVEEARLTAAALRQEAQELARAHAADQAPAAEKPAAAPPAVPRLELVPQPKVRALDDQSIGAQALLTYMVLSVVADAEGRYQGSQAELARLARCTEGELLEALRKLEAAGHVHRQVIPILEIIR